MASRVQVIALFHLAMILIQPMKPKLKLEKLRKCICIATACRMITKIIFNECVDFHIGLSHTRPLKKRKLKMKALQVRQFNYLVNYLQVIFYVNVQGK